MSSCLHRCRCWHQWQLLTARSPPLLAAAPRTDPASSRWSPEVSEHSAREEPTASATVRRREPVAGIHLLQRAVLSARFPWSAPFDNRRTRISANFSDPPPQIDQRRHVPRGAPFSAAQEAAVRNDPPPSREQHVVRTCRLRRFRGQRATGCDAGQSEHRLRGHSREARSEKVAIKELLAYVALVKDRCPSREPVVHVVQPHPRSQPEVS